MLTNEFTGKLIVSAECGRLGWLKICEIGTLGRAGTLGRSGKIVRPGESERFGRLSTFDSIGTLGKLGRFGVLGIWADKISLPVFGANLVVRSAVVGGP